MQWMSESATLANPVRSPYVVVLELTKHPTKMIAHRNRFNSHCSLLTINTHAANLHRNYRYSIICISLSITLTSAPRLPPPVKRDMKAYSTSAVT
jgi:hypothetical protein